MKRGISLLLIAYVLAMCVSCVGGQVQQSPEDSYRKTLYEINQKWQSVRTYVITQRAVGKMTDAEWRKFKFTDANFTSSYDAALDMLIGGHTNNPTFNELISELEQEIILASARKGVTK